MEDDEKEERPMLQNANQRSPNTLKLMLMMAGRTLLENGVLLFHQWFVISSLFGTPPPTNFTKTPLIFCTYKNTLHHQHCHHSTHIILPCCVKKYKNHIHHGIPTSLYWSILISQNITTVIISSSLHQKHTITVVIIRFNSINYIYCDNWHEL